jgi:hypothetical protein
MCSFGATGETLVLTVVISSNVISSGSVAMKMQKFVFQDGCLAAIIGKIENPGIMSCILIRCTYNKNLELIQPLLVQEL